MRENHLTKLWLPVLVNAAAIALVLYVEGKYGGLEAPDSSLSIVVLWLALVTVAAISPVPLPRAQASVSLTPALEFAGILIFGPAMACWIAILSRLICNAVALWNPFPLRLLKLGQSVLAVGIAGMVYVGMGGKTGSDLLMTSQDFLPMLAAAGAYLGIKMLLTGVHGRLTLGKSAGRAGAQRMAILSMVQAGLLPFGVLLALTQVRIGAVGVALFLIPLLLARHSFRLWHDTKKAHLKTVRTLMSAIDAADPFTRGLSYRIAKMSVRVGRQLGLSEPELEELEYAAQLHDIGRTAITREILGKPARLTEREQATLRRHPEVGRDLLTQMPFFPEAAEIVYAHHEQPDGKGYPRALKAGQIPMGSRIIMAVAAFDAMTSDRPYRRGLAPDVALQELLDHAGTQFFPEVVEALIQLYSQGLLFEEFDPVVLASYAENEGNSRAIAEHLRRRGTVVAVPEKLQAASAGGALVDGALALALPDTEPEPVTVSNAFFLDRDARDRLTITGMSDLGCVRTNNEDAFDFFAAPDPRDGCMVVLADGMGGASAGEVASQIAVETLREAYLTGRGRRRPQEALKTAIQQANRTIHDRSSSEVQLKGMGTTCTAAWFVGRSVMLGHVGDSRAYVVRPGGLERLTVDHTLATELGEMSKGKTSIAGNASHILTRCLGNQPDVQVDVTKRGVALEPGDAVLLCSDGLTAVVQDEEIQQIVHESNPGEACSALIELARARGGPDNITVVVARVGSV